MNIFIFGGTGFIGYHTCIECINQGHNVSTLSLPDIQLGSWFPKEVKVQYGNIFQMDQKEIEEKLIGFDAIVYALGPDDRAPFDGPAYEFFHEYLVKGSKKVIAAAREAGIKKSIILSSYFLYFDRIWPKKKIASRHAYVKCRSEQANIAIIEGGTKMNVIILELPYIFGVMPNRIPLWKTVFIDRFKKMKNIIFPKGGTNMIAVEKVAEAIVGALNYGSGGMHYTIGDENLSWREMLSIMKESLGLKQKIIFIPRWIALIYGFFRKFSLKLRGISEGLDSYYIFKDILTQKLYFDPNPARKVLKYSIGGVRKSIKKTMLACIEYS
jgi:dihydroflavonol-4-reductase